MRRIALLLDFPHGWMIVIFVERCEFEGYIYIYTYIHIMIYIYMEGMRRFMTMLNY